MPEPLQFELTLFPTPILRKAAEPVLEFDDELKRIVDAMYVLMVESNGVGLAAPQVGLKKRILILNPTGEEKDNLTLINPTIKDRTGRKVVFEEGCLSFPGIYADIERPERCVVEAFDVEGNKIEAEYDDFVSRIIQHEHDHLEGILLVDRMSPADKLRHKAALEDLVEDYKAAKRAAAGR